jgi:hypothetical protein
MRRYLVPPMDDAMPDDEVRFDASTTDTAATSLAKLVADVARLAASLEWQRHNLTVGNGTTDRDPGVEKLLPGLRQYLADTESHLSTAEAELAKGFAWVAKDAAAR